MSVSLDPHEVEEDGLGRRIWIVDDRATWCIQTGAMQTGDLGNEHEHRRTERSFVVHNSDAQRLSAGGAGEFTPFVGLRNSAGW